MATHLKMIDVSDTRLFDKLHVYNLVGRLRSAGYLERTHRINPETHKIEPIYNVGPDTKTPWVHVNQDPERECDRLEMIEKACQFIPTKCLNCWKVVVRPRTLLELFQLYNIQVLMNQDEDVYCKCGIEIDRPFVHALYGGYFYNDSKKEGLKRYKQIRELVDENISPDVSVILKKFCSEFELKYGNSKGYNQPQSAKLWEKLFDEHVPKFLPKNEQFDLLVRDVMDRWIQFAEMFADPTVLMFNEQQHLYTPLQTYHDEKEN
jgi:hypothetical protein